MGRGGRLVRPLMRLMPKRLIVALMRKMMGYPNKDIAKGQLKTQHLSIPGPNGDIPVRVYTPQAQPGQDLTILLYFHGGG